MVIEHSYRSYLFGRALGVAEGLECDDEALFAAAMFHDFAFAEMDELTDRCFTYAGAEVRGGVPRGLAALARSCATTSSTRSRSTSTRRCPPSRAPSSTSPTTASSSTCSACAPGSSIPTGSRRVAERHPRHGFTVRGLPLLRAHGRRVKGCRVGAALLAGFGPALRISPWHAADAR